LIDEKSQNNNIKPPIDVRLEDDPAGNFDSLYSFQTNTINAYLVGGTAAEPVKLGDGN
jgi:hypothetical protein